MSQQNGDGSDTYWEGYSDYRSVSRKIGESIDAAMDAYAGLQRMHAEGARVRQGPAAEAGQRILSAALRLLAELQEKRDEKDVYDDILCRWLADGDDEIDEGGDVEQPSEGFVEALKNIQLHSECPEWLYQFVLDIRTAGYELGYLQAGRTVDKEPDDPVEAESEAMFKNL